MTRHVLRPLTYVPPCLAAEIGKPPARHERYLVEFKEDGFRSQLHRDGDTVRIFSRGGHDWTERYATVAADALKLKSKRFIVDGEMVLPRPDGTSDFAALQSAVARKQSGELVLRAFDVLMLDGEDVRANPLVERKALLRKLLARPRDHLAYCEHETEIDGATVWAHAHKLNAEGLMFKLLTSRYRSDRTHDWIKVPCQYSETFTVIGYAIEKGRFDGLYLARKSRGKLAYSGKVEAFGVKRDLVKPILARLEPLMMPASPKALRAARGRWVKPVLRARIVHRAGMGAMNVRHARFEGWVE